MSRRAIFTIITLMSLALVGLIGFQLYWINNAIKLSEERFNKDVQESLRNVSERLERNELLFVASNSWISDDSKPGYRWVEKKDRNQDSELNEGTVVLDGGGTIQFKSNQNEVHEINVYKNVVVDSFGTRATFMLSLGDDDSVNVDVARVVSKSNQFDVIVQEMLQLENNTEHRVHPHILDSLLNEEFTDKGIHLKYEFGVFDPKKDTFVLAKFKNEEDLRNSSLRANLFPNDLLSNINYLTVNFPQQDQYLFRKVLTTLISSLLLIGIIVFSFVYAIRIILRQKKLSEIKNDFINNMTHEFKTPIATVSLACEALHEDAIAGNPKTYNRYLKVIGEETRRLESQVEKVLNAAQLEKEDFKIKRKPTNLLKLIQEVKDTFQFRIDELGGSIELTVDTELNESRVDPMHIKNVIQNLLDNAIKYTLEQPEINIRLYFDQGIIKIAIKDHGLGIRKDHQRNIFDKFYRVPTGNVHNTKGFGLGLSYVKLIMDEHRGKVMLISEPENGSTFTLSFPSIKENG